MVSLLTIDPYYNIEQYNEGLSALKNNSVEYKEFISTKTPFNWFLELPQLPIMTNFDEVNKTEAKFLIAKVLPARANEEYLLQRRNSDDGYKALEKFTLNEPLRLGKDGYACFFNIRNKEQLIDLSRLFPDKIWYFGKYRNKFKVAYCTNAMIKNFIPKEDILVEKSGGDRGIYDLEVELNFKIFRLQDRLLKYTETPYFMNGKYYPVKIEQFKVQI